MSATASTKKPDEVKTEESIEGEKGEAEADKPAPPKLEEATKMDSDKPEVTKAETEEATPTAPPPPQAGPSSGTAATGQEEEVKSKTTEKKAEVS